MFYEDVTVQPGETFESLAQDYGHQGNGEQIWKDRKNEALATRRKTPDQLKAGDLLYIPIPWKIVSHSLSARHLSQISGGARMIAERDGALGTRLTWVQTVYQGNHPAEGTNTFCVDGCPPDDDLPFYWTEAETRGDASLRRRFEDTSQRRIPSNGIVNWRAVLSLASVTKSRVTVWDSLVWGWDMDAGGVVTTVGPRPAGPSEISGHLSVLRKGRGTRPLTFSDYGWTFRTPPKF